MILYSQGCILSASLPMTGISAHKRGLQRCESFHYNKEDMMEVMICRNYVLRRYVISNIQSVLKKKKMGEI